MTASLRALCAASTSATVSLPKIQPTTVPRCISHLGFRRNLHTFNGGGGGGGTSLSLSTNIKGTTTLCLRFNSRRNQRRYPFQVRSVALTAEAVTGFDEMAAGTKRKYYLLGGKGGVGKTSCAASLAVKFANSGHPTLVVSTDPAHSLSDSFAQDLTGGTLVPVEGPESPLYALEINPEKAREEFHSANQKNGGSGVKDLMDSVGLGMLADQIGELKLGELLDTPPPGLDEAIAVAKVMQFLDSQEYNAFTRIIFDTAPTLREKIASAASAIKSVFGKEEEKQGATSKLEELRKRMIKVRELFRDTESTEFVIVTIPTVMAISESSRLCNSLRKESVPVKQAYS